MIKTDKATRVVKHTVEKESQNMNEGDVSLPKFGDLTPNQFIKIANEYLEEIIENPEIPGVNFFWYSQNFGNRSERYNLGKALEKKFAENFNMKCDVSDEMINHAVEDLELSEDLPYEEKKRRAKYYILKYLGWGTRYIFWYRAWLYDNELLWVYGNVNGSDFRTGIAFEFKLDNVNRKITLYRKKTRKKITIKNLVWPSKNYNDMLEKDEYEERYGTKEPYLDFVKNEIDKLKNETGKNNIEYEAKTYFKNHPNHFSDWTLQRAYYEIKIYEKEFNATTITYHDMIHKEPKNFDDIPFTNL